MTILQDQVWKLKYTPDHGDLVKLLYEPMLASAVRYDRLTGYFSASALALAARGIEGLIVNVGHMRMVVGCTLDPPEVDAIAKGETVRTQVEQHLRAAPLQPLDTAMMEALELLAWLIGVGRLDIRVAVPAIGTVNASRQTASSTKKLASRRTRLAIGSHSMVR
jgi:hypothetical protein